MSKQPRIQSAVPGQETNFATVLAHLPETAQKFGELYAEFWSNGAAEVSVKEMTRIRNARITDCGY